ITIVSLLTRPPIDTAQYATVLSAAPPRATAVWNSIRSSVTAPRGITPSNVAALMIRLRSVSGPSWAGSNASTTDGTVVSAMSVSCGGSFESGGDAVQHDLEVEREGVVNVRGREVVVDPTQRSERVGVS